MTATTTAASRPPILSRAMLLRFVSIVGASVSFYLPLAVVPLYSDAVGARATAGLATGALLTATVVFELATPRIVARIGYRWAMTVGLVLLGVPALGLLTPQPVGVIIAVSAVRGIGFAIATVAGGALTAMLIPAQRRGEGLAIVGLVSGIPAVLGLPAGIWAADRWGFGIVFAVTAAAPVLAIVTLPALPVRDATPGQHHRVSSGWRSATMLRPALIFAACTSATGVVVTYVPLAVEHLASWVAPAALFIQPATATAARWGAGRLGDRRGQVALLVPGTILSIAGTAALAATHTPAAVLIGAAVFGVGFGILQNATLALMYARAVPAAYSTVSAIWNAAYDLGMAVGAGTIGLVAAATGYPLAFLFTAAAMLPALVLAAGEKQAMPAGGPTSPSGSADQSATHSGSTAGL
jgi:MFS family permease